MPDRVRVGLVMLTWDDAELLRDCLPSLATTEEPFELCVVDNGSTDGSQHVLMDWKRENGVAGHVTYGQPRSLAEALNYGFGYFLDRDDLDFIGWVHPDMTFPQPQWLSELVRVLDENPEIVKLGAADPDCPGDLRSGNSQCYLVRRTALEQVGLFDERFEGVGGYEDWDSNRRLLTLGQVMITPESLVHHIGMVTRSRRDTTEEQRANADRYHSKWGTWDPPV